MYLTEGLLTPLTINRFMGDKDGKGDCSSCNVAITGSMVLSICDDEIEFTEEDEKAGVSCKTLRKDFEKGKITIGELVGEVRKRTTKRHILTELDDIVSVSKEKGVNVE